MRVLAISGSLRARSVNTLLLRALVLLAGERMEVVLYEELAEIPPFNPDLEAAGNTGPVARFREAIRESAVVIFSTPEYAHGLPGSLKNALDWVVGSGELSEKPVVLANASSRATYAQEALREVLRTMNARVLFEHEVTLDVFRKDSSPAEITREFGPALTAFLERLEKA